MDSDTKIRTLTESSLVRIIIPIYKNTLNELEEASLKQSFKVLKNHHFSIVCPEDLNVQPILKTAENIKLDIVRFPPKYFKGIEGYNSLMLSEEFYEKFLESKYILICQTDVIVIKDELEYWCSKDYDYIGAPWIASSRNFWNKSMLTIRNLFNKKKKSSLHFFKVGNGGFSLRNVSKHYEVVTKHQKEIEYYQQNRVPEKLHVEDMFFSLKAPELIPDFKIPDYKEALGFAMDRKPKLALKMNNNKLPFALHGFDKPKVRKFWKPIIKSIFVEKS